MENFVPADHALVVLAENARKALIEVRLQGAVVLQPSFLLERSNGSAGVPLLGRHFVAADVPVGVGKKIFHFADEAVEEAKGFFIRGVERGIEDAELANDAVRPGRSGQSRVADKPGRRVTGHVEFDFQGLHYDARPEIETLIKSKGGTIKSVSKKLDYLIAGEEAGSKLEKAEKAGVKILDAAGLIKLLDGKS